MVLFVVLINRIDAIISATIIYIMHTWAAKPRAHQKGALSHGFSGRRILNVYYYHEPPRAVCVVYTWYIHTSMNMYIYIFYELTARSSDCSYFCDGFSAKA